MVTVLRNPLRRGAPTFGLVGVTDTDAPFVQAYVKDEVPGVAISWTGLKYMVSVAGCVSTSQLFVTAALTFSIAWFVAAAAGVIPPIAKSATPRTAGARDFNAWVMECPLF